jgi:hypothetical protein
MPLEDLKTVLSVLTVFSEQGNPSLQRPMLT